MGSCLSSGKKSYKEVAEPVLCSAYWENVNCALIVLWAMLDASGRDPGLRSLLSKLDCLKQKAEQGAKRKA